MVRRGVWWTLALQAQCVGRKGLECPVSQRASSEDPLSLHRELLSWSNMRCVAYWWVGL